MKTVYSTVARLQMWGADPMFNFYAAQDPKNSEVVVPQVYQGGLSLPDRQAGLRPCYVRDELKGRQRLRGWLGTDLVTPRVDTYPQVHW